MAQVTYVYGGSGVVQIGAGWSVDVKTSFLYVDGSLVSHATQTGIAVAVSDPLLDRYDAVTQNLVTGNFSVQTGTPGKGLAPIPDGEEPLALIYIAAGAGAPTSVTDAANRVFLPEPSESMTYTLVSGTTADVDPGAGRIAYNNNLLGTITSLFVSYFNPIVTNDSEDWIAGGTSGGAPPYYIRLFRKSNPENYAVYQVTAVTKHTNYDTLTVALIDAGVSRGVVGARGGMSADSVLGNAAADLVVERTYFPIPATTTNGQSVLGADVTLTPVNTFVDILNTGALAAGTYFLSSNLHGLASGASHTLTSRIFDGTNSLAEGEIIMSITIAVQVALCCIVTVTGGTTLKLQAASDTGTTDKVKAAVTKNSGGNLASILTWVKIA